MQPSEWLYLMAPVLLAGLLLWRWPDARNVKPANLLLYAAVLFALCGAAAWFVAVVASARVIFAEVLIAVWFAIGWRLAWELWVRTAGRCGQRWVRLARRRVRLRRPAPFRWRLIRPARATLTGLVFIPLFLGAVMTHHIKFADGQTPSTVAAVAYESICIPTHDGLELDAWFVAQRGSDKTMLICHGAGANKGNFVWFLVPFFHTGYNLAIFDFRGHGASDGHTITYGLRERYDVIAVVDWLKRHRPEQSRVVVGLGSSQGALALALAAADDPRIDAVVLDSPFVSPRELAHHHAGRIPLIGPALADLVLASMSLQSGVNFFSKNYSAEQAMARMGRRPVFIIRGEHDIVMPRSHATRLYQAARGPRQIWHGPGLHSNIVTTDPDTYARRVLGFLDTYLSASRPMRPRPPT